MSTSTESCNDLDMAEPDGRENVYSSSSSYSTYSREVKYIFNPADDSADEYGDYSHINPRLKQNYMSHTPSVTSATSGKENRTPHIIRDGQVFEISPHVVPLRTGSVHSGASRDRGPISPHLEEALYSSTYYGCDARRQTASVDHGLREKAYLHPGNNNNPSHLYSKQAVQVWKNSNMPLYPLNVQKMPNGHLDMNKHKRNTSAILTTFQTQHPLTSVHSSSHYQHPKIHHRPAGDEPSFQQQPQNHGHTGHEPSYPNPPRYNHQHHARRKTWSPPALKMSLLNANSQGTRVCYSNDSLDTADEAAMERRSQSLSEDLDVTPPKLTPFSGVLAHKPGPNLIKPIAFKPINAGSSLSPIGSMTVHQPRTDDHVSRSQETSRQYATKIDNSIIALQGSPESQNERTNIGGFHSVSRLQHQNSGGSAHLPYSSQNTLDNTSHSQTTYLHPTSSNNSCAGSQRSSSICFNRSSVSNNTYSNIPAVSHNMSANFSHLPTGSETSFPGEFFHNTDVAASSHSTVTSRVLSHGVERVLQTPSPSDSGVGELEAILREKDSEINTLREVMDRNERAIFQVYEERRNDWLQNTQELQNDYERKLKIQSRKSYKTEQVLSLQVYKLQQEQKSMLEEKANITAERDLLKQQAEENQSQISQLKISLEAALAHGAGNNNINKSTNVDVIVDGEASGDKNNKDNISIQEELALKNKELITIKSKLQSFQADMDKKNKELAEKVRDISSKTEEVKVLKDELSHLRNPPVLAEASSQTHAGSEVATSENMKPTILGERDRTISSLQEELIEIQSQIALMKEQHEREREQWLDEKNRVVRYQKQLQLNYVQIQRKNTTLETEVQQLTLDLENRDLKLIALTGDESVC